jgi:tetratricopeptide (TPR) repeat protein
MDKVVNGLDDLSDGAAEHSRESDRPVRPITVPNWLRDSLGPWCTLRYFGVLKDRLVFLLQPKVADPEANTAPVKIELLRVNPDDNVRWLWRKDSLALRYLSESSQRGAGELVARVGLGLEPHIDALDALFTRAIQWVNQEADALDEVLEQVRRQDINAGERAQALSVAAEGKDADVLALALMACDDAPSVIQLAERVSSPGPLLRLLAALLHGDWQAAVNALTELPDAAPGQACLIDACSDLAARLGARSVPVFWAQRTYLARKGARARATAGIKLAERLYDAGAVDAEARIDGLLAEAAEALTDDAGAIHAMGLVALRTERYDLAGSAFRRSLQLERRAEVFADLAQILLWRGDTARARECVARARRHCTLSESDGRAFFHRLDGLGAACDVLDGHPEQALPILEQVANALDDLTWWVWLTEARFRVLGPVDTVLDVLQRADFHHHRLIVSVLTALVRGKAADDPLTVLMPSVGVCSFESLFDGRLDAFLSREEIQKAGSDGEALLALLERVLKAFGGNRSPQLTYVGPDGVLLPIHDAGTPRMAVAKALYKVRVRPAAEVLKDTAQVVEAWPKHPEPRCYHGELLLWLGRFDEAMASFQRAQRSSPTRWAFIGEGAVHTLRGEVESAQERFAECRRLVRPIEGSTLVVYRGEAYRRAGDWEKARVDLELAVRVKPSRVGAWANLALVRRSLGDEPGTQAALGEVWRRVPHLLREASRLELGEPWSVPDPATMDKVLMRALELCAGNRSSSIWTYITPDGEFRVLADTTMLRHWAKRHLDIAMLLRPMPGEDG